MDENKDERALSIYKSLIEKDYCAQWLGVSLLSIKEGYCALSMTVRQEMLNGLGILHGGIAFTFADVAFAVGANSYGRKARSINSNITYSKSAQEGETLIAEAKALNVTFKTADFDVVIMNDDRVPYYFFRGTVYRNSEEILI